MKNILLSIIILLSINSISKAQSWDGKGDFKFSVAYEFYGFNSRDNLGNTREGIVSTINYGISDNISIGSGLNYNIESSNFYLNLRSDYHFQQLLELSSNFDVYAGIDFGYHTYYTPDLDYGIHIGTRFMFTDAIGLYMEIGNRGNVGLSYNF